VESGLKRRDISSRASEATIHRRRALPSLPRETSDENVIIRASAMSATKTKIPFAKMVPAERLILELAVENLVPEKE